MPKPVKERLQWDSITRNVFSQKENDSRCTVRDREPRAAVKGRRFVDKTLFSMPMEAIALYSKVTHA